MDEDEVVKKEGEMGEGTEMGETPGIPKDEEDTVEGEEQVA